MRRAILLVAFVGACAKTDAPADTASMAPPAATPAPQALTSADLTGTWQGTTMPMEGDSVLSRWTIANMTDSAGTLVYEGSRDSVMFTRHLDGDSLIAESRPYRTPSAPRTSPMVTFRSVGWLRDGKLTGTVTQRLASNPDSVVARLRWEATRATP